MMVPVVVFLWWNFWNGLHVLIPYWKNLSLITGCCWSIGMLFRINIIKKMTSWLSDVVFGLINWMLWLCCSIVLIYLLIISNYSVINSTINATLVHIKEIEFQKMNIFVIYGSVIFGGALGLIYLIYWIGTKTMATATGSNYQGPELGSKNQCFVLDEVDSGKLKLLNFELKFLRDFMYQLQQEVVKNQIQIEYLRSNMVLKEDVILKGKGNVGILDLPNLKDKLGNKSDLEEPRMTNESKDEKDLRKQSSCLEQVFSVLEGLSKEVKSVNEYLRGPSGKKNLENAIVEEADNSKTWEVVKGRYLRKKVNNNSFKPPFLSTKNRWSALEGSDIGSAGDEEKTDEDENSYSHEVVWPILQKGKKEKRPKPHPTSLIEVQMDQTQRKLQELKDLKKTQRQEKLILTPEEKNMTRQQLTEHFARQARERRYGMIEDKPLNEDEKNMTRYELSRVLAKERQDAWIRRQISLGYELYRCPACSRFERKGDIHNCYRTNIVLGKGQEQKELVIQQSAGRLQVTPMRVVDKDAWAKEFMKLVKVPIFEGKNQDEANECIQKLKDLILKASTEVPEVEVVQRLSKRIKNQAAGSSFTPFHEDPDSPMTT